MKKKEEETEEYCIQTTCTHAHAHRLHPFSLQKNSYMLSASSCFPLDWSIHRLWSKQQKKNQINKFNRHFHVHMSGYRYCELNGMSRISCAFIFFFAHRHFSSIVALLCRFAITFLYGIAYENQRAKMNQLWPYVRFGRTLCASIWIERQWIVSICGKEHFSSSIHTHTHTQCSMK